MLVGASAGLVLAQGKNSEFRIIQVKVRKSELDR